jgi:hypothetical protein
MTLDRRNSEDLWRKKHIITSLVQIFNEIITDNTSDQELTHIIIKQKRMAFTANKIPTITIYNYIERIIKYSRIDESTLILSLIYIDKACELNNLLLTEYNIHRYSIFNIG